MKRLKSSGSLVKISSNIQIVALLLFISCCHLLGGAYSANVDNEDTSTSQISLKDLKKICDDKKFPIESIPKMKEIILGVNKNENICPDRFVASFNELDGILKYPREQLCSEDAFEMIKGYHFRFISPPKQLNKRLTQFEPFPRKVVRKQLYSEPRTYAIQLDDYDQAIMMPLAVRHFFLSFALQLSAQCKRNLLANYKSASEKLLTSDDRNVMDILNENNPVGQIMREGLSSINFDNALYLPELEGEIKNLGESVNKKVFVTMKVAKDSALNNLIGACQLRFKPIYDKLLMPVIKLSKLGYNYLGDKLSAEERKELTGPDMKAWLALTHVCEMFDKVIAIKRSWTHEEASKAEDEKSFSELVREDEAEELGTSEGLLEVSMTPPTNEELTVDEDEKEKEDETASPKGLSESVKLDGVELGAEVEAEARPVDYTVEQLNCMEEQMWICSSRQLDLELSRKSSASNPFGLRGFFRRAGKKIKKQFAKLDFKKFAHYRRHSQWYSGFLNFLSALSNVASITVTLYFTILPLV